MEHQPPASSESGEQLGDNQTSEPVDFAELLVNARLAARKEARKVMLWGTGLVVTHLVPILLGWINWHQVVYSIFFVFGVCLLVFGIWEYYQSDKLTVADVLPVEVPSDFIVLMQQQKQPFYTWIMLGALIAVALCQPVFEAKKSIAAAGLVKDVVRRGEWWRLATSTVMHVNFLHIWMNGQALHSTGKLMEALVQPELLPLVFLVSASVGSFFSLVLLPHTTSVGASGGLLGVLGFIAVLSYRRQKKLPKGFYQMNLISIAWITLFGVVGFAFVDNAAHFGGLLAGASLGTVFINPVSDELPIKAQPFIRWLGYCALAGFLMVALLAISKILSSHIQ